MAAKHNIILLTLLSCLCLPVAADHSPPIKPFMTDGCSLFPDGMLDKPELWLACCIEHDKSYWQGGTWHQRKQADEALQACVSKLGQPEIAALMLSGVRVGGSAFWPTWYRWGYGWDYLRGYKPLNEHEKQLIQQALQQYRSALKGKPEKITEGPMSRFISMLLCAFLFTSCSEQQDKQSENVFQGQIDALDKAKTVEDTLLKANQQQRKHINEQSQ